MLTLAECGEHIRHALDGVPDTALATRSIVARAGSWFCIAHPWRFMVRPPTHVNLRGSITVSAGVWTEGSRTLTSTGSFTNYTFLEGDEFEATGGTSVTAGFYQIVSRPTADTIVLRTSLGASATTGVVGKVDLRGVALPSDFGEMVGEPRSVNMVGDFQRVTYTELLDLRAFSPSGVSPFYYYAIVSADSTATAGGAPVPRMELDRPPTTSVGSAIQLIYRAKFTAPVDDQDRVRIPDYCETAFLRTVRAQAQGWEESEQGTLGQRYMEVKASPEFQDAIRADGSVDGTVGPMRGGAALRFHGMDGWWHRRDVVVTVP